MLTAFLISLFGFIFLNIPIAFALVLTTVVLMLFVDSVSAHVIAQSIVRGIDNFPLMAIPLFMLAGDLMSTGGISIRIVNFAKALVGHLKGALGYVAVTASMIFSGVSGSAVADTSAIGSLLLPIMKREGYDVAKSTALIAAAGSTGPIIPPSIPMIIYGVIGGVSVVKLFLGGIIPGIIACVGFMFVWYLHARKREYPTGERMGWIDRLAAAKDAFWALMLPIIILGGILFGIYTPTEAAVIAVAYSFVVGMFIYKELKFSHLPTIFVSCAKATSVVLFLCGAAMAASYMLTTAHVPELLMSTLSYLSQNNVYLAMFWINLFLLIVGCVMDLTPALLILGPMLLPVAESYGLDPVYFGVVMICNLCVGLLTPPIGTVLYVGCGLSKLKMSELTPAMVGFIGIMIVAVFIITYIPGLVMFIPNMAR